MPPISRSLAEFVLNPPPLPPNVRAAGRRSLLNMIGTAIGGASEPAITLLAGQLGAFSGPATASLIGRAERADMLWAAYINAASANIFDFDDTHIPTVIHPSAPVGGAVLALCEQLAGAGQPVSGAALIEAFVLGVEITCRLGAALHPGHYARGWHITSTCGTFGAAVAAGRLLGLGADALVDALSHALAQNSGSVETLGSMSKSLSVGQAARGGLLAAILAKQGYTGISAPIEGLRGFLALHSDAPDLAALTGGLGTRWEILKNTFKPYPCGVVLNPVIEACLELHGGFGGIADEITAIDLTGHPLLRQRTDRPDPPSGRMSQVSAQHAVAVSLLSGRADLAAFSDKAVANPALRRLGGKLRFHEDAGVPIDSVAVRLILSDGREVTHRVAAAKGGLARPLTDAELAEKLQAQIAWRGAGIDASALIAAISDIEAAPNGAAFVALTRT